MRECVYVCNMIYSSLALLCSSSGLLSSSFMLMLFHPLADFPSSLMTFSLVTSVPLQPLIESICFVCSCFEIIYPFFFLLVKRWQHQHFTYLSFFELTEEVWSFRRVALSCFFVSMLYLLHLLVWMSLLVIFLYCLIEQISLDSSAPKSPHWRENILWTKILFPSPTGSHMLEMMFSMDYFLGCITCSSL